ncbi:Nif3-like dinuclear metal center hexameric protein [Solimicrobium silvestre]|uniref:Dinuclear metal center protein, YbgI/SA1388 family n=1 Tax=Solimicrobium silvestre TaxID=2099400 RepID=A0A2S9H224_9BURK|nr:Nif3-like dinuclear metal center hexameric protein [Solimicrobium silvestre]PRC93993.1 Dinuclear metal center protein, YbgI/SA1388 family [Solimicrobium silvestre]
MNLHKKLVSRDELSQFLADKLQISRINDYCPNGLQVEGVEQIKVVVSGVTASLALIEAAIELQADCLIVHHGYFWRGENPCLVGPKYQRIKKLINHNINLYGYHLPLDLHPEWGNNVQLARQLELVAEGTFADQSLASYGYINNSELRTVGDLSRWIEAKLGRTPLLIGEPDQPLGRIAWCTGAAQNFLDDAINIGATVYLSGEISEPTVHLARESGVAYLACGHHATERYGVQALGQAIAEQFGVIHHFVDIPNPV